MPILGMASAMVNRFNVGPLTLRRSSSPVQNARGVFETPSPVDSQLDPVAVHTVSGRELEQLPEADRHRETIRLYTKERLNVTDDGNASDRVVYDGRTYRVTVAENYERQGGVYMSLAVLEEEGAP